MLTSLVDTSVIVQCPRPSQTGTAPVIHCLISKVKGGMQLASLRVSIPAGVMIWRETTLPRQCCMD